MGRHQARFLAEPFEIRAGSKGFNRYVFLYNFSRIHGTLKRTPALATGVTDRLWRLEDMFG